MKAIGVVRMTESAINFPLLLYSEYFNLMQIDQFEYTEGLKYSDNHGHFIIL